jgi:hypothetical protein
MKSLFVCVYLCPPNDARHRHDKHVHATKYTHVTAEELLDSVFSVMSVRVK